MGKKPRTKPQRLAPKLLAIREHLHLNQPELATRLEMVSKYRLTEFESGRREPNLIVLLRYARLANVSVESLIDDEMELPLDH